MYEYDNEKNFYIIENTKLKYFKFGTTNDIVKRLWYYSLQPKEYKIKTFGSDFTFKDIKLHFLYKKIDENGTFYAHHNVNDILVKNNLKWKGANNMKIDHFVEAGLPDVFLVLNNLERKHKIKEVPLVDFTKHIKVARKVVKHVRKKNRTIPMCDFIDDFTLGYLDIDLTNVGVSRKLEEFIKRNTINAYKDPYADPSLGEMRYRINTKVGAFDIKLQVEDKANDDILDELKESIKWHLQATIEALSNLK